MYRGIRVALQPRRLEGPVWADGILAGCCLIVEGLTQVPLVPLADATKTNS